MNAFNQLPSALQGAHLAPNTSQWTAPGALGYRFLRSFSHICHAILLLIFLLREFRRGEKHAFRH